jgi:hypothetical protein
MTAHATDSGLIVYTPSKSDQAWDSPLPATPYFSPRLRLRAEGDVESGFTKARAQPRGAGK